MKLNKKLALFLFAIGVGVTVPAFANSCQSYCVATLRWCTANSADKSECYIAVDECMMNC